MRCEVLQTRNYMVIGLRHEGEIIPVPDWLAEQLVAQGFMKPYEDPKPKKRPKTFIEESEAKDYDGDAEGEA